MTRELVQAQLTRLRGLQLSITGRSIDLRQLHFGRVTAEGESTCGEWAIHIQCPWRLVSLKGVVTGSADLYRAPPDAVDFTRKDFDKGNLQDYRLGLHWGDQAGKGRRLWLRDGGSPVSAVIADDYGGFELHLLNGDRWQVFPASASDEHWRLFDPQSDDPHFVVSGEDFQSD